MVYYIRIQCIIFDQLIFISPQVSYVSMVTCIFINQWYDVGQALMFVRYSGTCIYISM
jgi:hypothetical protein